MLSLFVISVLSRGQKTSSKQDSCEENTDRVDHQGRRVGDSELEHSPPMKSLEEPESQETTNDLYPIEWGVLIDSPVIGNVDWVVLLSITGDLGSLLFRFRGFFYSEVLVSMC